MSINESSVPSYPQLRWMRRGSGGILEGMNVDIAQMHSNTQQAAVRNEASMAILSRSLDVVESQGDQMVNMVSSAGSVARTASEGQIAQGLTVTDPALGAAVDLLV